MSRNVTTKAGIYILTLNNVEPISANAHDPRIAHKSIMVTRANCKFGKAQNLDARRRDYEKTFQAQNVNFFPIAEVMDSAPIERAVLLRLRKSRVRGKTGRCNEWLFDIEPLEVERVALEILTLFGLSDRQIGTVQRFSA